MVIEVVAPNNVYGDESIQADEEAHRELYAVTAYVANFDSWIKAEQEWQAVLAADELSEFHTTDFLGRWGEFRNDWPDERRDALMERLCSIAADNTLLGVGCGVTLQDYNAALPKELRKEWHSPYHFCVYGILSLLRSLSKLYVLPQPLYFLFDQKKGFEGEALKLYREYQHQFDPDEELFGAIAFGSRKKFKPLQIADLLVHIINRRFKEMARNVQPADSKMLKPLDILMRKKNVHIAFPDETLMTQYLNFARRSPLSA